MINSIKGIRWHLLSEKKARIFFMVYIVRYLKNLYLSVNSYIFMNKLWNNQHYIFINTIRLSAK